MYESVNTALRKGAIRFCKLFVVLPSGSYLLIMIRETVLCVSWVEMSCPCRGDDRPEITQIISITSLLFASLASQARFSIKVCGSSSSSSSAFDDGHLNPQLIIIIITVFVWR